MNRRFLSCFGALAILGGSGDASVLDSVIFGNDASEETHGVTSEHSEFAVGGLGEPCRRLLPRAKDDWQGGLLRFHLQVDGQRQNYFTIRLWGDDRNANQLTLHVDGKQVGYRHLGDIEALDLGTDSAAYPGRFHYRTCPLPMSLTRGRTSVACEIRASGPISAYSKDFGQYQKPMTEPTRGIYRVHVHTDPCFVPPAGEVQGKAPAETAVRAKPGPEVLEVAKARVNGTIDGLLKEPARPANQMQGMFLAEAWHVPWTHAAGKPETVTKVLATLDALYLAWRKEPKLAEAEPSTYNPEWYGLGPCGRMLSLLEKPLRPRLDEPVDDGAGGKMKRRDGYRDMLVACRDWHREHRRQYTNQSMINDLYGIYLANRGVAVVAPSKALPEKQALRYLREAMGLDPWLGSEKDGKPLRPLGDSFYQLTAKGLTKELGYVGSYGEVLDWVNKIVEATRAGPGRPPDKEILAQAVKIALARAPFRYPLPDPDGFRAMVLETQVGWRDAHVPGVVTYVQRQNRDGGPLELAATTLDPRLVGHACQMIEDNQFFASVERMMEEKNFRATYGLLGVPESHERIMKQKGSVEWLPMSPGQPNFVFSDEENGVVAVKNGDQILYASLYWRARHGVNSLARVHWMTPETERVAVVKVNTVFTPSGMEYTRPDWTNFGFANGGHRYPAEFRSAHAGETLPIARIPDGIDFKPGQENIHAGRGDLYQLEYGPYFIAMNMSADKNFDFTVPKDSGKIINVASGMEASPGAVVKLPPRRTVVLWREP